jgi:hypothetical protein
MTEYAALEQIVASKTGIRMGSCVSGKDREEMITEMALVMTEFYAKYGRMPPPADCKKEDKALRDEFVQKMAEHFLSGHGQMLAGENAAGCNGLKNVKDVLGKEICARIVSLARERGMPGDPLETTDKIAGINKLSKKKVKDKSLDLIRADCREQAILSHAGRVLAPAERDESITQSRRPFARRATTVELTQEHHDASLSEKERAQLLQRRTTIIPSADSHAIGKKKESIVPPPHVIPPPIKPKN